MTVTDKKRMMVIKTKTPSDGPSLWPLTSNFAQRLRLVDKGGVQAGPCLCHLVSTSQYHASLTRSQQKVHFELLNLRAIKPSCSHEDPIQSLIIITFPSLFRDSDTNIYPGWEHSYYYCILTWVLKCGGWTV